jgi:hypothetical protein
MNVRRVLLGGIAAGFVIFMLTGVLNGALLSEDFQNWSRELGSLLHPTAQPASMILWTLMSLIYGIGGVWLYAGIRPRFGAGAKTALRAGFILWFVSKVPTALDFLTLGILPEKLLAGQVIGSLVSIVAGVFLGAFLYKE